MSPELLQNAAQVVSCLHEYLDKPQCWSVLCLQELKGNIRVFCRVRPLIGADALSQTTAVDQLIQFPSSGVPLYLPQLVVVWFSAL